jgi:3-dehydroquinate synthase
MHELAREHTGVHGFTVPFHFPVLFTRNVWNPQNGVFKEAITRLEPGRRHRVLVVVDDHVAAANPWLTADIETYFNAFPESLDLVAPPMLVTGGEACKNDLTAPLAILQKINDVGLDRQSFVAVVGGGAVLDMVSFAAAIAHRGIRVVRIPTTVLSQGDSAVGVKNGVNLFGKKNFIGTFVPPFAVINDPEFFRSLEPRDQIAGVVEAIKVALLKDPAFYQYLEAHADRIAEGDVEVLAVITRRSAELHLTHICGNGDPFELGSARPLDFGHWAAHKLESMTGHRLRHGEAVAIGIALDLAYSVRMGYLDRPCATRIMDLLEAVGFKLWDDALLERDAAGQLLLVRGLQEFREHLGGELTVTLLRGIGLSFEVTHMDAAVVAESVELMAPAIEPTVPRLRGVLAG